MGESVRDLRLQTSLACIVAACGLATSETADANALSLYMTVQGASCQLSIPTTNTGVRPKATGFRNESTTTSNFVICSLSSPTDEGQNFGAFDLVAIVIRSMDGMAHDVSCTAVTGQGLSPSYPLVYSSKTVEVPADASQAGSASWLSDDFGQPGTTQIKGSAWTTVTCNLPPQAEIRYIRARYNFEIGS
jgi:hypothetical protein